MKIAVVAPCWQPVPPAKYGSVERVVDMHCRGLQRIGHEVVLFASEDSTSAVPRFPGLGPSQYEQALNVIVELNYMSKVYENLSEFDIIHDHTMLGPVFAQLHDDLKVVTTNHDPFDERSLPIYRSIARRVPVVAISKSQASSAPFETTVIHHGVDLEEFSIGKGEGNYALWIGRMIPQKGAHLAARAARKAGMKLLLAGRVKDKAEREYFEAEVKPELGEGVEFLGEVGGQDKVDLIGSASCVLMPIVWAEPFGLVFVEALACGTPVVAFRNGSVPEIIDHGTTGFICDDEDEMASYIKRIGELSRSGCREAAASRFSIEAMARAHVELYERVLSNNTRS